ncbi:MAG: methyl-accepting chemotaxis protein [Thermodesulfobacterium sp.]|nr:methyl-accepting chemotaxis protein [Thermodesulfobacterium sp.]
MKIANLIKLIIGILIVFSLLSAFLTLFYIDQLIYDGRLVNYAGMVRGGTQRLIKLETVGKPSNNLIETLDKILVGLSEGSKELNLPKVKDEKFLSKLKEVKTKWNNLKELIRLVRQDKNYLPKLIEESESYFNLTNELVSLAEEASRKKVTWGKFLALGLLIVNILLFLLIFVIIHRKIIKSLYNFINFIEKLTQGDLTQTLEVKGKDEISLLASYLNKLVDSYSNIINKVLQSVAKDIDATDRLRETAYQTLNQSKSLASQSLQISASAEQMSQTIAEIAKNTTQVAESSEKAMQIAISGKSLSDKAVTSIESLYQSSSQLSEVINRLNQRTREIEEIVTIIKDIADQTNLLALNATIEAARAGEHGRGFAVVAEEIRRLAERTIKATEEISERILNIQNDSVITVKSMETSLKEVKQATDSINELGNSIQLVVESFVRVKEQITQIASAVEEQSITTEDVAKNIEKVSQIAKNLEAVANGVMDKSKEVFRTLNELRKATEGLKTKEGHLITLDLAKTDHRIFVGRIFAHLEGATVIDVSKLTDHRGCKFGKWYLGEGMQLCGHLASFKALDEPHAKVHALAREVILASNRGDRAKAFELFKELEKASQKMIELIEETKRAWRSA